MGRSGGPRRIRAKVRTTIAEAAAQQQVRGRFRCRSWFPLKAASNRAASARERAGCWDRAADYARTQWGRPQPDRRWEAVCQSTVNLLQQSLLEMLPARVHGRGDGPVTGVSFGIAGLLRPWGDESGDPKRD